MLKFFSDLLYQLRANHEEMVELRGDIKELLAEMRKINTHMIRLNYEILLLKERMAGEREKELLRFEIEQLREALGIQNDDDDPDGFVM